MTATPNATCATRASSTSSLFDSGLGDSGLLYDLRISATDGVRELDLPDLSECIDATSDVLWLHFNLTNARARDLLTRASFLPDEFHDIMAEVDVRRRVESVGDGLIAVFSDLSFDAVKEQRVQLGRIRRFCARMRRHFAPDVGAFAKLLQRAPAWLDAHQADSIRNEIDDLSFLVDEAKELYERAKLLQEELASRVAEDTGRHLYVLAILSAVFLPMTLITGIFGMNVAGLPGLHSNGAFWSVLLLIIGAGAATLLSIFRRNRS